MQWSDPVSFETQQPGRFRSVDTPLEALRVLDGWWQKVDGPAYKEAINVCINAVRGDAGPEEARAAFIGALTEGGIYIGSIDDER